MAYNMSKAATDQMARTAAIELIDYRIRVNTIHPGWIDTPGERKFVTEEQIASSARSFLGSGSAGPTRSPAASCFSAIRRAIT